MRIEDEYPECPGCGRCSVWDHRSGKPETCTRCLIIAGEPVLEEGDDGIG